MDQSFTGASQSAPHICDRRRLERGAAGFCGVAGDGVLQVQGGTLELIGNGAGDKLSLASSPSDPGQLLVDVGEDGTIDFAFNRSTFDAIDVQAGGGNDTVETSNGLATSARSRRGQRTRGADAPRSTADRETIR